MDLKITTLLLRKRMNENGELVKELLSPYEPFFLTTVNKILRNFMYILKRIDKMIKYQIYENPAKFGWNFRK